MMHLQTWLISLLFGSAQIFGGGTGTISQLPQFSSTTTPSSAITQTVWGKAIKITGLTVSQNLCLDSSGFMTTTGCTSSGGGGGAGGWTFIKGGIYNSTTTDQVIIGRTTTTTNAKLEVSGDVAATFYTATSTTATSTIPYLLIGNSTAYTATGALTIPNLGTSTTLQLNPEMPIPFINAAGKVVTDPGYFYYDPINHTLFINAQDKPSANAGTFFECFHDCDATEIHAANDIGFPLWTLTTQRGTYAAPTQSAPGDDIGALRGNAVSVSPNTFVPMAQVRLTVDPASASTTDPGGQINFDVRPDALIGKDYLHSPSTTAMTIANTGLVTAANASTTNLTVASFWDTGLTANQTVFTDVNKKFYSVASTTYVAPLAYSTSTGSVSLQVSGVTAGSYTNTNLTVDANGRITTASTGSGGSGGTGNVATSAAETAGQLPYWTTTAGTPAKLGGIATTTLTATYPILVSNSPVVIGSSPAVITFPATSTLFGTGTGGQYLVWSGGLPTWSASTTYQHPLTFATSTGQVQCPTCSTATAANPSASVGSTAATNGSAATYMRSDGAPACTAATATAPGCITALNWAQFNAKVGTSTADTAGQVLFWSTTSATPALASGNAAFSFSTVGNTLLTVTNATTTNLTAANIWTSGSTTIGTILNVGNSATSSFTGGLLVQGGLKMTNLISCNTTSAITTDSSGNFVCGAITGGSGRSKSAQIEIPWSDCGPKATSTIFAMGGAWFQPDVVNTTSATMNFTAMAAAFAAATTSEMDCVVRLPADYASGLTVSISGIVSTSTTGSAKFDLYATSTRQGQQYNTPSFTSAGLIIATTSTGVWTIQAIAGNGTSTPSYSMTGIPNLTAGDDLLMQLIHYTDTLGADVLLHKMILNYTTQ